MDAKTSENTKKSQILTIRWGTAWCAIIAIAGCQSSGAIFHSKNSSSVVNVVGKSAEARTELGVGHIRKQISAPQTVVVSEKQDFKIGTAGEVEKGPKELSNPVNNDPLQATAAHQSSAVSTSTQISKSMGLGGDNSLPSVEQTALANHPGLQELQEKIAALEGKWLQVGLRPNTHLGFSGQQLYSGGQAEQIGMYVGQQIVRQSKLDWNRQIVCLELDVARQQLEIQRQRVLTDVRQNYYQVLVAQERVAILERLAEIATQAVTAAESLQRAGEGTQIDILRATVEQQATQVELANAQTTREARWSQLIAVVGIPHSPPVVLAADLTAATIEIEAATYWSQLQQQSPELLAVLAERERAQATWQRARVEAQPDVDVESVVQYDQSTGGANANLQVSMPIPWRDWNQGNIQQTRSEWMAAEQAVQRVELGLQQRLAVVFQDFENARQQIQAYRSPEGMIANSQKSLQLIDAAYRAGEIGFLDLITAQKTNAQTNLLYLTSLERYWNAYWELEGMLLKGSLE